MRKKKKGFSLIELLTVLAITAILLGIGITQLLTMRNRTLAKQALDEFIQNYNSVRNSARNSVLEGRKTGANLSLTDDINVIEKADKMDYYAVKIVNDSYYKGTCEDVFSGFACTFDENDLKDSKSDVIDVKPLSPEQCSAIIFSLSTGHISFGSVDGNQNITLNKNIDKCEYRFSHVTTPDIGLDLSLDKQTGKFDIST